MANEEHLKILRSGVKAWNRWRPNIPRWPYDRSVVEAWIKSQDDPQPSSRLREADLSDANLSGANLSRAVLDGANLRGAELEETNLSGAGLSRANLNGADLSRADLSEADLREADLTGAMLIAANLYGASLKGAKLSGVGVMKTLFCNVDLSRTSGLDDLDHYGPSSVDHSTLELSGRLPEPFLRGVGFSDEYIGNIPSLFGGAAINLYSCFISYSSTDRDFAKRLHDSLQGRGVRCWLDEHQILPGEDIRTEIDLGIRVWDKVLLCCSKTSLTESSWVDDEIEKALIKERRLRKDTGKKLSALIPLNLDGYVFSEEYQGGVESEIIRRNAADFTDWKDHDAFEASLEKVIKALRLDGGKPPAPHPRLGREPS